MRVVLILLALGFADAVHSQTVFSLQPQQASEGQSVDLLMDDPLGCVPAPQIVVQRAGNSVTVEVHLTDVSPCLPEWSTPRRIPLGTFTAGDYEVQAFFCGNSHRPRRRASCKPPKR